MRRLRFFTTAFEIVVDVWTVGERGRRSMAASAWTLRARPPVVPLLKRLQTPPMEPQMSAHVIAMISSKGGVGRTTVGMLLATNLARRGRRVVVVDADLQAAASTWSVTSPTEGLSVVKCYSGDEEQLATTIQNARVSCDVVIVDCPARNERLSERAARCADVVLAPVTPGAPEVWAAPQTVAFVARVRADHPQLRFAGVINRLRSTRLATKCLLQLIEMDGLPLLRAHLSDRTSYTEACLIGLHDPVAIQETDALAREVLMLFSRKPDGSDAPPLSVRGFSRYVSRRGAISK